MGYQSVMPPDMELFLCGWLRERLAEAGIDALVSNKEPEEAAPYGRPAIVVRDDGGPQLQGVVFDRGVGVSVLYGDRRADFEAMRLARLVYAWLTNPLIVTAEGSPVAWVDTETGSNGPFRMVDEAGNARVYMTVEFHAVGELVEIGPTPPLPPGTLTFTPAELALEEGSVQAVEVSADGAPVPFGEALVSVGPAGAVAVSGGDVPGVWSVLALEAGEAIVSVSWTDPHGRVWEGVLPVTVEAPTPLPLYPDPAQVRVAPGLGFRLGVADHQGAPFVYLDPADVTVAVEPAGAVTLSTVIPSGVGLGTGPWWVECADVEAETTVSVSFAYRSPVTGRAYEGSATVVIDPTVTALEPSVGPLVLLPGETERVTWSAGGSTFTALGLDMWPAATGTGEVSVSRTPPYSYETVTAVEPGTVQHHVLYQDGANSTDRPVRGGTLAVTVAAPLSTTPAGGWTQQPGSAWTVEILRGETALGYADVTMTADTPGVVTMVPVRDGAGLGLYVDEAATAGTVTCLFTHTHEGVLYGARFTVTVDPALAGDVVVDPPTGPEDWWPEPSYYRYVGVYLDSSLHYAQIDPVCEPAGLVEIEQAVGEYKVTPVQAGTGRVLFNAVSRDDPEEGGWRVFVGEWPFTINAYIEPYAIPGRATMPPGARHYLTVKQMDAKSRVRDIGSTGTGRTFTADPSGSIQLLSSSSVSELRFPSAGTGVLTCTSPVLRCDVTCTATTPLVCGQGTDIVLRGQPVTLEFTYEGEPVPAGQVEVMRATSMTNVGTVEIVNGAWTITPVAEPNSSTGYVGFLMREPVESDLPGGEFIGHCVDLTVTTGLRVLPQTKTFDLDLPYTQAQAFSLMWGNRMLTAADNVTLVSITPAGVIGSAYVDTDGKLQLATGRNPADWHAGTATIVLSAQPLQPSSARVYTAEITVTVTGGN